MKNLRLANEASLRALLDAHPLPLEVIQSIKSRKTPFFTYGTAGFRCPSHLLPSVVVRMGLFASLRSHAFQSLPIGIMITASHNPAGDNGIKLADVGYGRMLDDDTWEEYAIRLVNALTTEEATRILYEIYVVASKKRKSREGTVAHVVTIDTHSTSPAAVVHVGRDTRPSSPHLASLVVLGAKSVFVNTRVVDHGIVTTPMLHSFVMYANSYTLPQSLLGGGMVGKGWTERGYYGVVANAYVELLRTKILDVASPQWGKNPVKHLIVDCACGVGSIKLEELNHFLERLYQECNHGNSILLPKTEFILVNRTDEGPLNGGCGAEFVQKSQLPPKLFTTGKVKSSSMTRWCSLDGDADRIVFHYTSASQHGNSPTGFHLLDGDKIAVLVAMFVREELRHLMTFANSLKRQDIKTPEDVRFGVVQTAYANGSSTAYLRDVAGIPVQIAKTGVKHVHACAEAHFDVGVYFEPNGHGTALFGPKFYVFLAQMEKVMHDARKQQNCDPVVDRTTIALQRLRLLPLLINQAVGDAISDLLLVEAILHLWGWDEADDFTKWSSLYTELPSRQCKVTIKDRNVIHMNDNETQVVYPVPLRDALTLAVQTMEQRHWSINDASCERGKLRCFVRPSGTEDVVRIYAEAPTQQGADELAQEAAALTYKLCCGVGDIPTIVKLQSRL